MASEPTQPAPDERADMIEALDASGRAGMMLAYLAGYRPEQFDALIAAARSDCSPLRGALERGEIRHAEGETHTGAPDAGERHSAPRTHAFESTDGRTYTCVRCGATRDREHVFEASREGCKS